MTVYLVGAGPGDPGLLTRRGADVLGRADVVVFDRLAEPSLLDLAPPTAERIDVGKQPGAPVDQGHINDLLIERARAGATVVRLKGGDPFVFGRGGEEAAALAAAGVAYQVVPGVSSAVAVPAYAGIPVTHRGLAANFTVVTGHSRHDPDPEPEWELLAQLGGTIVILMGVAHRDEIARRLMKGGLAPDTPVAAVVWGTHPHQRSVRTRLDRLGAEELDSPAVLVVGAVAALELEWFSGRPLWGRKVVVTRAADRAADLTEALAEAGAEVVSLPVTVTRPASDGGSALTHMAGRMGTFAWVVFTSVNAVDHVFAHIRDARAFAGARVAAVGPATAAALAGRGVEADVVSPTGSAEGLVSALGPAAVLGPAAGLGRPTPPGGRLEGGDAGGAGAEAKGATPAAVLLPRSEQADRRLPDALAGAGWVVVEVPAYRTVPVAVDSDAAAAAAEADAVVVAAGSAVRAYAEAGLPISPALVCIGESTAEAAREAGLVVSAVAARPEPAALVEAVIQALSP